MATTASSSFTVTEHLVDAQYMREYPRATATPDAPLQLKVNKYTPVDNPNPAPGDVTIIGFHGTGFPKEMYEPLWEDLLARSKHDGFRIRAIWIADAVNSGHSATHNEKHLDHCMDHSRDILAMVNRFRDDMPQPIMGVAHSLGSTQMSLLALIHPRLFASLVLVEPFLTDKLGGSGAQILTRATIHKKDLWPSRVIASEKSRKVFAHWDPRVFDRWVRHGYRDLPTLLYPDSSHLDAGSEAPVTLTTTKHQELFMYARPNLDRYKQNGRPDKEDNGDGPRPPHDPLFYPDVLGEMPKGMVFYRSESLQMWRLLPHIRPTVLFVGGAKGLIAKSGMLAKGAARTGTRFGGSGGMEYGRVSHTAVQGAGHDVPFHKPADLSNEIGPWLASQREKWADDEKRVAHGWQSLSGREKTTLADHLREALDVSPVYDKHSKL